MVAIKVMSKAHLRKMGDLHRAYREINAMKKLSHQHISQLYQVVETEEDIFMVMEYLPGGELFDYIVTKEKLTESEARRFFRQIIAAVAFMHEKGLAHRDLKPENMLLDESNNVKLIDFGLASDPDAGLVMPLATCCGSPAYAAPELISGREYLGNAADVWSLGVVLYGLLCGYLPFDVDHEDETYLLYQKIKSGEYDVPDWLSEESVRILSRLLETDPERRITITELLTDEWVREGYGANVQWQSVVKKEKPEPGIVEELAEFYGLSKHEMERQIKQYKYDHLTAHYFLLLKLRRNTPRPKKSTQHTESDSLNLTQGDSREVEEEVFGKWFLPNADSKRERAMTYCGSENDLENKFIDDEGSMPSPLRESKDKSSSVFEGFCMVGVCTPARHRKFSIIPKTPLSAGLATPKFAKKLKEKVVHLMTPRKGNTALDEPRKVKAIYKVNSTSTKTATEVRDELNRVLSYMRSRGKLHSIDSSENYLFKCKGDDERGNKLSFELEICSVPGLENVVGIRHKRLKGDAWAYKKICDSILNIAKI
ncbi:maternal embryonic leucine zipper kinase-like isoform X2 [Rhopilema esculentum]|uniref:maternal embryonic leucine zipper kinase-like isoform X2 n=1 Tax=Rhopilema esculentum TaxID=499914 RepID=UPI0031CE75E0